jgi:chromosome segregation ATPase
MADAGGNRTHAFRPLTLVLPGRRTLSIVRWITERRLTDTTNRLRRALEELRIIDEQADHLERESEDARIRTLVNDTMDAERQYREARGPAQALLKEKARLIEQIAEFRKRQDQLLDQLSAKDNS